MISDENRKRVIEKMSAYLVERLMSEKNLSRDIAGETLKKSLLYLFDFLTTFVFSFLFCTP